MSTASPAHPAHLDPSELGTKDYWDNYYNTDLSNLKRPVADNNTVKSRKGDGNDDDDDEEDDDDKANQSIDPSELPSWFSDVSAPEKILSYLTSETFPLAPENWPADPQSPLPSILDLGTGNGSLLFLLRTEGEFIGNRMCGIDYSDSSIELSKRLGKEVGDGCEEIEFYRCDILKEEDWRKAEWWPKSPDDTRALHQGGKDSITGWDIVLDKGTFDAISLSAEEIEIEEERDNNSPESLDHSSSTIPPPQRRRRICELYPRAAARMLNPGGYLLITSCNWTEDEVIRWFVASSSPESPRPELESDPILEVYGKVKYSTYKFGGQEGQGVATVCFKRVR
ncbi:putative s-adenosylmethionine-dependent methyltransferase [Phaeomoniella chlamydospora]|uniref:Protein-lysine N-methyltransferase EFM4 n=1 Tax=Phaeomoniella chlamydospora TaxID=158046 RepID=A0A0G2GWB2_PHACM|nr:putative s-adenosylmethionine-dependent methyltransferase [Phaeomoniella chlamydospora]